MEEGIVFGNRIFLIRWLDDDSWNLFEKLYEQMLASEDKLTSLMDECKVPREIILNFKKGDESLYGQYFVQEESVSKEVIIIDIYTKRWIKNKNRIANVQVQMLDTLVHELLHNKYREEYITREKAREFLANL